MSSTESKEFRDQLGRFRLDSSNTTPPNPIAPSQAALWSQPNEQKQHSHHYQPENKTDPTSNLVSRSKRVSTACDFCRKRKKKCDFRYPNCSACTRAGVRCTIPPPGPQAASASVPRDQLENLQKRVLWLEDVVRRKSGISVAELATGTPVDGEGDLDWWYQVPTIVASVSGRPSATSEPSPAGSGVSLATAGPTGSESSIGVGTELPNIGEIFRDQLEHRRPFVARPAVAPRVLRLSSFEEAEKIASQYFDSMGYQYPFMSRPEFMVNMRYIYAGGVPSPEVHNSYHIVIAISLLISSGPSQAADFYHASQETLPSALQNEDLPAIRALLGLALYTMFAMSGPSIWHLLGTTMRLAISLGLHKGRTYGTVTEEEMAKRAFWSLYNLDRLIASTLGRPLGIADEDITVGLPRELNDDCTEIPSASAMTIPLQVIRLRRIFSRIYRYCEFLRIRIWITHLL